MIQQSPLKWPYGWPRTKDPESSRFGKRGKATIAYATGFLIKELDRLGANNVVINTNLVYKQDGLPYSNQREPKDKGVAVYFTLLGRHQCIPCDKWDIVADNMWAIAKTIEAIRGIERWGAKDMVNAAFQGFQALPAPDQVTNARQWYFSEYRTRKEARAKFIELSRKMHPDQGGDQDIFADMKLQYEGLPEEGNED